MSFLLLASHSLLSTCTFHCMVFVANWSSRISWQSTARSWSRSIFSIFNSCLGSSSLVSILKLTSKTFRIKSMSWSLCKMSFYCVSIRWIRLLLERCFSWGWSLSRVISLIKLRLKWRFFIISSRCRFPCTAWLSTYSALSALATLLLMEFIFFKSFILTPTVWEVFSMFTGWWFIFHLSAAFFCFGFIGDNPNAVRLSFR